MGLGAQTGHPEVNGQESSGKKIVTLQRASFAKENSCTWSCVQQLWSNNLPPANEHVLRVRKGTSQLIVKENAQHIRHLITLCLGRKN